MGLSEELETSGRKRKTTTNNQHWKKSFRADNIRVHMTKQHSQKFAEYEKARKTMDKSLEAFKHFFEQSTVDAFFENPSTIVGKKRIFTTNKNIVEVILKEMLMPLKTVKATDDENGEDNCPRNGVTPGDRGMRVLQPIYMNDEDNSDSDDDASKVVSCYQVTISNPLQFDYVVSLLADGMSFRKISQVVLENRD